MKGVVKTYAKIQNVTYSSINLSEVQAGGDLAITATKADSNIVWPILIVAGILICIIVASLLIYACGNPDSIKGENFYLEEKRRDIYQKDNEDIYYIQGMEDS